MKNSRLFTLLIAVLLAAPLMLYAAGTSEEGEAEARELSFLTWNHGFYEDTIDQWIAEFEEEHPGVTLNWIDRSGSELPTYYQTQLATGNPPDVTDFQGTVWYGYAADGVLMDLSSRMEQDSEMNSRFDEDVLNVGGRFQGSLYAIPHYAASTVLFYNKPMFEEAGLDGPPQTMEELISNARTLTRGQTSGFITLNFDWEFWPLFRASGVRILNEDGTAAAFNTPEGVRVLTQLRDLTAEGVIDEVAWTGRWNEPNGMFGAGNAAMLHAHINAQRAFRSQSEWASDPENVGVAPFPGEWSVPNYHSFTVYSDTDVPDLAWDFLKLVTNEEWNIKYGVDIGTLPSNNAALEQLLNDASFAEENPLLARMFEVNQSVSDHLCCTTGSEYDAEIKEAVYSNVQQAVLGQKSPQAALADAERRVNQILSQ